MATTVAEVAQALALAYLNHGALVGNIIPPGVRKGDTSTIGIKLGELYVAIYEEIEGKGKLSDEESS